MNAPVNHAALEGISTSIKGLGLDADSLKQFMRELVGDLWPYLPEHSKLERPYIAEEQQASVACGVVPVFKENGVWKVLILKPGTHYQGENYDADPRKPRYTIPGGYANLTLVEGSAFVEKDENRAEHPKEAAARELEEELRNDKGNPVIEVDPTRLKPMDIKTVMMGEGRRDCVMGCKLELTKQEASTVKAHVARLNDDPDYRRDVREFTKNPHTRRPEVCTAEILNLKDIAEGQYEFLYEDQRTLFKELNEHLNESSIVKG